MERNGSVSVGSNKKFTFFSRSMLSLSASQHSLVKTSKKVMRAELWHAEA
jgi:hypothetical protein